MRLPPDSNLCFAGMNALQNMVLRQISASVIVSPLATSDFDAYEVASLLQDIEFSGTYRVLSPKIPKRSLVLDELQDAAPDVDIDVLELSETSSLAAKGPLLCQSRL